MFKSFRELFKGVSFGVNHDNNRQLGFSHPSSVGSNYDQNYNSNDDVLCDVYLKDGSTHQVKLVDAKDYIDQNKDKLIQKSHKFRRARLG
jgi:hypothetical protein